MTADPVTIRDLVERFFSEPTSEACRQLLTSHREDLFEFLIGEEGQTLLTALNREQASEILHLLFSTIANDETGPLSTTLMIDHTVGSEELEIRMRLADTLLPQLPDRIKAVDVFMADAIGNARPSSHADFGPLTDFPELLSLRRLAEKGLDPLYLHRAERALSLLARRHFRECRRRGRDICARLIVVSADPTSPEIGVITRARAIAQIANYTELPPTISERLFEWIANVIKTVPTFIDGTRATPEGDGFIMHQESTPKPREGAYTPYLRSWRNALVSEPQPKTQPDRTPPPSDK
jgi:hypothetical protein